MQDDFALVRLQRHMISAEVLRALLWEGNTNYQGSFFKVALPTPRTAQVPLLISALGPKAFQLAGEIADGALPWMSPIPYLLKVALPALRAGAEARQRSAPPVIAHVWLKTITLSLHFGHFS
jgi:alkanesulfonate monooxygenase SsuD/methylene tetrahydromethanopterin reductase-like flavin-dependent oxidoreductase (luciferase family)